jgi:hypothetical protein
MEFVCLALQQPVYQKAGSIFFRKNIKSVVTAEQSTLICLSVVPFFPPALLALSFSRGSF